VLEASTSKGLFREISFKTKGFFTSINDLNQYKWGIWWVLTKRVRGQKAKHFGKKKKVDHMFYRLALIH
jgi:hypothetical protein